MFFNAEDLRDDCGLKFDKQVILNKEPVLAFLNGNEDWLSSLPIQTKDKDGIHYGSLENGYLYKIGIKNHLIERLVISSKRPKGRRIRMKISYDGTFFSGFQVQSSHRSVQGEIEKILSEIHNHPTKIVGASRTDAGVHAYSQFIHFDTDREDTTERWLHYFHKRLPKDIHAVEASFTHPLFHARYDVIKKEYRYRINPFAYNPLQRNFEWFVEDIDISRLKAELKFIEGTHDFTSFCKGEKDSHVRTIYKAYVDEYPEYMEIVFEGDGFLRYMIRLLVNALVKISKGDLNASMKELIEERSRKHTIHLAPAEGLYLSRVDYQ